MCRILSFRKLMVVSCRRVMFITFTMSSLISSIRHSNWRFFSLRASFYPCISNVSNRDVAEHAPCHIHRPGAPGYEPP